MDGNLLIFVAKHVIEIKISTEKAATYFCFI